MRTMRAFFQMGLFLLVFLFLVSCDDVNNIPEDVLYTITFESNEGSVIGDITEILGSSIDKPTDPIRSGYIFNGWYVDEALSEPVIWPISIKNDLTLYAKWIEEGVETLTYDVIFNTMGGSVIDPLKVEPNTIIQKPLNPTKNGYTFINWYEDENYTQLVNFPITINQHIILYAKWEINDSSLVRLSYYDISEVSISKVIISELGAYTYDEAYYLTTDGKILYEERIFNQLTYENDIVYVELPIKIDDTFELDELIVDVIVYEPVFLFKLESGRWFGIEIGEYATGEYLGVANEVVSIDMMLGLDLDETIVQINHFESFFYATTSKNRVFVAGTLTFENEDLYVIDEVLEITDEFQLDTDEYFISNDPLYDVISESQIALKTNKRMFIPRELVVYVFDNISLHINDEYFIDINDIDDNTYEDAIFGLSEYQFYLQLLSNNSVQLYQYYGSSLDSRTFTPTLNTNEDIFVLGTIFMTTQNRLFGLDGFYPLDIDDQVNQLTFSYYPLDGFDPDLYPIFKTETNKYYVVNNGLEDIVDITDEVSGYTLIDGFWFKDEKAYTYDFELEQMVLNSFEAITIHSDMVEKDSIITEPVFDDERYLVGEWFNIPEDLIIDDDLLLIPVFDRPYLTQLRVELTIPGFGGIGEYVFLPENKTYTADDIMTHLDEGVSFDGLSIDMAYLEITSMKFDGLAVNEFTLDQGFHEVAILLELKDNKTIVTVSYKNPYGDLRDTYMYAEIGTPIDFDLIASEFSYPVSSWYDTADFDTTLDQETYTRNLHIYAALDYPMTTLTFVLSHDLGSRTIEYVEGYDPDYYELLYDYLYELDFQIVGFFTDQAYTNEVSPYHLSDYDTIYIKLGNAFEVYLYGSLDDYVFDTTIEFVEGRTFAYYLSYFELEYYEIIGFYYDLELTQMIDIETAVPSDLDTIYLKLAQKEYKMVDLIFVGGEKDYVYSFKFYEGTHRLQQILKDQMIIVDDIDFYTDSLLQDYFGYEYTYMDFEEMPSTLYVSIDHVILSQFVNVTYDIDFVFAMRYHDYEYQLEDMIYQYFDFDEYQVFNELGIEVIDFYDYDFNEFEMFELILEKLPRTTVSVVLLDQTYEIDSMRIDEGNPKNINILYNFAYQKLHEKNIEFDDVRFYSDETKEVIWNEVVTEGLVLYIDVYLHPRTDIVVVINDDEFIIEDMIIDSYYYNIISRIDIYLRNNQIVFDEYNIYVDASYEVLWDEIIIDQLKLYVEIVVYPRTNVTLIMDEESFTVSDVPLNHEDYDINEKINTYLNQQAILFDEFNIYFDSDHLQYFDGIITSENQELYLEVIYYERTTLTIHINDEIIVDDDFIIEYGSVHFRINHYLNEHDMYWAYDYIIYVDSGYEIVWNDHVSKDMVLYVELFDVSLTTTVSIIYDQETIYNKNHNLGYIGFYQVEDELNNYLLNEQMTYDDIRLYFDQALTKPWDGYVRENMVLYLDVFMFELTDVTVYINQDTFITVSVLTGPDDVYFLGDQVLNYIEQNNIPYDDIYGFYVDSEYKEDFNGYVTENLVLYINLIYYQRTTVYVHVDDVVLEVDDVKIGYQDSSKFYYAVSSYLNEESIPYDLIELYEDQTYTDEFNHYLSEMMHLYAKVVNFPRTTVFAHLGDIVYEIDNQVVNGDYDYALYSEIEYTLAVNQITFNEIEIYLDEALTIPWDLLTEIDMHVYVKTIIYPKTDVTIHINDEVLIEEGVYLNGDNRYYIYYAIEDFAYFNDILYDYLEIYVDEALTTKWDDQITENMTLYVKLLNYTLDELMKRDYGEDIIYYVLAGELTDQLLYGYDTMGYQAVTVLTTVDYFDGFIYRTFLDKDGHYEGIVEHHYEVFNETITNILYGVYDGMLKSSVRLETVEEINQKLSTSYPTWEQFLYTQILTEHLDVHVLSNVWIFDGIEFEVIDVVVGINGMYKYWGNFSAQVE